MRFGSPLSQNLKDSCFGVLSFTDCDCQPEQGSPLHSHQIWTHRPSWQGMVLCEGAWRCTSLPSTRPELEWDDAHKGGRTAATQQATKLAPESMEARSRRFWPSVSRSPLVSKGCLGEPPPYFSRKQDGLHSLPHFSLFLTLNVCHHPSFFWLCGPHSFDCVAPVYNWMM